MERLEREAEEAGAAKQRLEWALSSLCAQITQAAAPHLSRESGESRDWDGPIRWYEKTLR